MRHGCLFFLFAILTCTVAVAQSKEELWKRDSVQLLAELSSMLEADQAGGSGGADNWKLVEQADAARTRRMIEIIQTYGFPTVRRCKSRRGEFLAPYIILLRSPKEYFETLRPLLEAERRAGRIHPDEYTHIIWHLNGRVGKPDFK